MTHGALLGRSRVFRNIKVTTTGLNAEQNGCDEFQQVEESHHSDKVPDRSGNAVTDSRSCAQLE